MRKDKWAATSRSLSGEQNTGPARTNTLEKKRAKIIETHQMPIWRRLSQILFYSMLLLSVALLTVDVTNYLRHNDVISVKRLCYNLSVTSLSIWGIYTVVLSCCCCMGMYDNRRRYERRKQESGIADLCENDRLRSKRAITLMNRFYVRYITISLAGLAVFVACFLFARR